MLYICIYSLSGISALMITKPPVALSHASRRFVSEAMPTDAYT